MSEPNAGEGKHLKQARNIKSNYKNKKLLERILIFRFRFFFSTRSKLESNMQITKSGTV